MAVVFQITWGTHAVLYVYMLHTYVTGWRQLTPLHRSAALLLAGCSSALAQSALPPIP
jgi:hypothetical protein